MQTTGLLWFGVFTLSSTWFWIIVMAWAIATFTDIHRERPGWVTLWLTLFVMALHLGGIINVIQIVRMNPWTALGAASIYIVIGLVWTVFKFKFWLRKRRILINEDILPACRKRFMESRNEVGETIPTYMMDAWRREQQENYTLVNAIKSMNVRENKSRLTMWAIWWPISMIWTMISDWITEVFSWLIFDLMGGFLNRMVDSEKEKISAE